MLRKTEEIITAQQLKSELPSSEKQLRIKSDGDRLLRDCISGKDKRFLVVCGPCSADDEDALCEYVGRLKKLSSELCDKMIFVPRVFTAKPRTNGEGYLGMMYQPDGGDKVDINKGLRKSRKMMLRVLSESEMPLSDELLYPEYYDYLDDLVSYFFIGARSSENPEHRNIASGLEVAVGVKNSTGGNLISLAGSVHACLTPKEFLLKGYQVETDGNPYSHAVFRGFVDESGVFYPNYSASSLNAYSVLCDRLGIGNKFVLVDCSHANSSKQSTKQMQAAINVVRERNPIVGGIMLESYLFEGKADKGYGISKTDSCLSWEETENVLREVHGML